MDTKVTQTEPRVQLNLSWKEFLVLFGSAGATTSQATQDVVDTRSRMAKKRPALLDVKPLSYKVFCELLAVFESVNGRTD